MTKGDSMAGVSSTALSLYNTHEPLPLVVSINCIEDCDIERESLAGVATFEHVSLSHLSDGRIESAAAVVLHSLAYLPRAAQRRLGPWQLLLCIGSADRAADSAIAADLGLRLVHVDASREEEIADTVMALFLGLLRRTHLHSRHSFSASSWLGSVQPVCRGMRRCSGLVLGIVGKSASARLLATRSLAFKIAVLYFDVDGGTKKVTRSSIAFPQHARRMDTLNDLLAASDLISIHCTLTNDTIQIINAECLHHIKPGAFLVNIGNSQLLDDCALKQLLIDGTLAGCALDGTDAPQWMEAWIRELPNVLILPRGADYSEEVWLEIREKTLAILQAFFLYGVVPNDAVSDEDEDESCLCHGDEEQSGLLQSSVIKPLRDNSEICHELRGSDLSHNVATQVETKRVKSGRKARKRHSHQQPRRKSDKRDDSTGTSSTEQVLSSSSCFVSPVGSKNQKPQIDGEESSSKQLVNSSTRISRNPREMLKDGCVVALHARGHPLPTLHVSRKRVKDGGWFLDTLHNVTIRDPAAQFLVASWNKDNIGLRSFTAGGKLLQINRRMEYVFASHTFDAWQSWFFEGSLEECRLVNCRNSLAVLEVSIEVLASADGDGVTRSII